MKKNLLILMILCISAIGYSQTFTENFITYTVTSITNNTVKTTDYDTAGGTVVTIPSTVTNNSITYTVSEIEQWSFSNNGITSVDIPNSVTTIHEGAFAFNQLNSIVIPDSVTFIEGGSFRNNQLTSVEIPNSITSIEVNTFAENQLTNVLIPNTIISIGGFAFENNQLITLIIPNSVSTIGLGAFQGNLLTTVFSEATAPPVITTGGNFDSFGNARSNIDLTIPAGTTGTYVTDAGALWTGFNSVTEDLQVGSTFISNFITYEVTSITNNTVKAIDYDMAGGTVVDIPATLQNGFDVTEIGVNAFLGNQLTSVTIPNSVTEIGAGSFADNQLASLVIPNSVISIGNLAFQNNQISSLSISNNITSIGLGVFSINQLTNVTIPNSVTSIGDVAFQVNQLTSVTIPDSVTSIGNNTFAGNQLASITIPSSVANIGNAVFWNNPLTSVISEALIPPAIVTGTNDSFNLDRSGIDLTIPAGTTAAYITDPGALWTGFNSVTEDLQVGDTYADAFITYEFTATTNNTVMAINYDTTGGTMVAIPATITNGLSTYNVTAVGDNAFQNKGLTSVTMPSSIVSLGDNAFSENELATISIPDGIMNTGNGTFSNNLLTSISLPNSITAIGSAAFATNQLTAITIPENVITIDDLAFWDNQLTALTIPDQVTNIGAQAFDSNPLIMVTSEAITPPIITTSDIEDTFGNRSTIDLFIPGGTLSAYVTDPGALWTDFKSVTDPSLGIANVSFANEIKISTGADSVQIVYPVSATLKSYSLYNISGVKIMAGTQNTIATSSIAHGIYLLKLDFDKGTVIKKVVIK